MLKYFKISHDMQNNSVTGSAKPVMFAPMFAPKLKFIFYKKDHSYSQDCPSKPAFLEGILLTLSGPYAELNVGRFFSRKSGPF